jgi:membrane fusion protein (multidrug efflux system)
MNGLALFGVLLAAASTAPVAGRVYQSHLMVEQDVALSARLDGVVSSIQVERGQSVEKGQALCTLDTRALDLELAEAEQEMKLASAELERFRALASERIASPAEIDEKTARYEVARARYEVRKELRDRAVIRAPFAGIVTERYARIGQKVLEDEQEPLFKLTAREPLLARVYLPEEELLSVKVGDPVEVVPVKFPDSRAAGHVHFISPVVEPASGTFQVLVRVRRDPARSALRPGVAVEIRFPAKAKR